MIPMRSRGKRAAALAVDAAIGALAPILARRGRALVPTAPRVLVIRCDHIGDAVMATTVLRPLRDALNPATLDVLAGPWAAPVFEGHPAVDRVIRCAAPWWSAARGAGPRERLANWAALPGVIRDVRAGRYDVGIDLRGDLRQIVMFLGATGIPVRVGSDRTGGRGLLTHAWAYDTSLHEVEKNMAIVAMLGAGGPPRLDIVAPRDRAGWLQATVPRDALSHGYAAFCLHGSEENRGWPAAHAAAVSDALYEDLGLSSVYVGTADAASFGDAVRRAAQSPVIDLSGRTSLAELLVVLQRAAVTIAVDSGPMHVAAAVGSPVVALFGAGNPRESRPWAANAQVVSARAPCGCIHPRCDYTDGPGACMREIEPGAVIDAVRSCLETTRIH